MPLAQPKTGVKRKAAGFAGLDADAGFRGSAQKFRPAESVDDAEPQDFEDEDPLAASPDFEDEDPLTAAADFEDEDPLAADPQDFEDEAYAEADEEDEDCAIVEDEEGAWAELEALEAAVAADEEDEEDEAAVDGPTEELYLGFVAFEAKGNTFMVEPYRCSFDGGNPKITPKSMAPKGIRVGSWVSFAVEYESESSASSALICVDVQLAKAPEDAEAWAKSLLASRPQPKPLPKTTMAQRLAQQLGKGTAAPALRPKPPDHPPRPKPPDHPPPGKWDAAGAVPSKAPKAATATAPLRPRPPAGPPPGGPSAAPSISQRLGERLRSASDTKLGAAANASAAAGYAESGAAKSSAVAAFRQAKIAAQGNRTTNGPSSPVSRVLPSMPPPFKRAFLAPPEQDEEQRDETEARRAELNISLEDADADFPLIEAFEDIADLIPDYAMANLRSQGFEHPLPIQAQTLPVLLSGRDLIGIAQTGSGKTLAYLLPSLVHIEAQAAVVPLACTPVALVLAPTRELAVQIADEAKKLVSKSSSPNHPGGLGAACIYGGKSKAWQVAEMRRGCHIVAATPGRLVDLIESRECSMIRVTYLVLDEADRMLDFGFAGEMSSIAGAIRPDRQTLFFSATWPDEVQALAKQFIRLTENPVKVSVGQKRDGAGPVARTDIIQEVVVFDEDSWEARDWNKSKLLYAHLREVLSVPSHKVLVFVNRKTLADEIAQKLYKQGFKTNAMHGSKKQDTRLAILQEFKEGECSLLVCTDVMGRGLDIPQVSHVVIYDMGDIDDYVHRIGRTARGPYGKGHALILFEFDKKWPDIPAGLIDMLERSDQEVPDELRSLAARARGMAPQALPAKAAGQENAKWSSFTNPVSGTVSWLKFP